MAAVTTTNNAALYKRWYENRRNVQDLTYPNAPLWGMLPKREDFTGAALGVAIITDGPVGGRSHTFTNAQGNKTAGTESQFLITRVKDYSLISIEQEALLAAKDDKGAFLKMAKLKTDQALKSLTHNLSFALYGNGGAARGQVGSTSTTTLTLKDTNDVVNFAVGQYLDSSTTDGTSGSADGGSKQVTAINRQAGTLTAATNWTSASNFSDDDYIFVVGDFGAAVSGLDAWLPASAPGATAFFGVDRSVDTDRLGGIRYDGTSDTIEEALINAEAELAGIAGGDPTTVFMHPKDVRTLKIQLGSKVQYDVVKSVDRADISWPAVVLHGSRRAIRVIADAFCPKGVCYMLDLSTWMFASLGRAPMIGKALGAQFQWDSSADSVEIRAMWYGQLYCNAPGYNVRIDLPG